MSIEAHVFTPESKAVAIPELTTDMATVKVFARVIRNFRDWSHFDIVGSGNLQDVDLICGWLPSPVASEIEAAITSRNRQSIEGFLMEGNLGACGVGVRDIASVSPDERANLAEVEGGDDFVEVMRNAMVDYDAYSAAGRNDLSILLQFRLTQVIAKQRGGVWTDPVSGDYLVVAKGQWERLPCLAAFEEQNS
ncbi:MAG: hypothetical protein WCL32_13905 [Planctomycetota bacterium]